MASPIIELHNVSTCYGTKQIHRDLNLEIFEGEVLGIVGGSGSGKTTLLRAMLMLQPCETGEIKIMGHSLFHIDPKNEKLLRRNWGVMFQHGALFSSLTILENVAFPLSEQTQLNQATIEEIALLKIALVGLPSDAADKYPSEISGGMRKRVAVARAIVLDPKIIFLDEPTAGLDPQGASGMDELILSLKNDLGLTVVLITHDLDTLWQVTDRVAFLGDAKVLETKPIAELYQSEHPLIHDYFTNPRAQNAANILKINRNLLP